MNSEQRPSEERRARDLIDQMLQNVGWTIIRKGDYVPNIGHYAVEEVETDSGPMDYGLYYNGVIIGDVEAKSERSPRLFTRRWRHFIQ